MSLGNLNIQSFKRYLSPQATQDLNHFLENLPQNTNNSILVVAAVIWASAGAIGLYTFVQSKSLAEQRAALIEMEAVKPSVPVITNVAESTKNVGEFVTKAAVAYPDLNMSANGSSVMIEADATRFFPQFREAIGHVQNGGRGWRVNIEDICVGRECSGKALMAKLKVNRVSIETNG